MAASHTEDEDDECELGKREFWDSTYARELQNLHLNGDEGEVWFGEEVMHTLIEWLHLLLSQHYKNDKSIAMLDVGTGNALLPLQLAKLGYSNLTGSDYSAQSIALSKHILQRHGQTHIQLLVCVFFDVITDKGTLDAVGLMQDADINRAKYQQSVWSLLKSNGLLVRLLLPYKMLLLAFCWEVLITVPHIFVVP
ncbi:MAG: methyltransferase 10 [Trebouxia sp. A1-2]|nr:MAG: methyltransferase 10 [Trebouxia sp. A1-2]